MKKFAIGISVLVLAIAGAWYSARGQGNNVAGVGGGSVAITGAVNVQANVGSTSNTQMEANAQTNVSTLPNNAAQAFPVGVVTFGLDPCLSSGVTKSSVAINITSATTTSLVATSASTIIYPCSMSFTISPSATSADTVLFEYGTGAACVTTQSVQTGTFGNGDVTSAAAVVPIEIGEIGPSAAAAAFCAVSAGTAVSVQGILTYVQK